MKPDLFLSILIRTGGRLSKADPTQMMHAARNNTLSPEMALQMAKKRWVDLGKPKDPKHGLMAKTPELLKVKRQKRLGSRFEYSWNGYRHSCCGSRTCWRHLLGCPPELMGKPCD